MPVHQSNLPPLRGRYPRALRTGVLRNCLHVAYLEYNWNGLAVDAVYEMSQLA